MARGRRAVGSAPTPGAPRSPRSTVAFLVISLIYFETPARPRLPALSLEGAAGRLCRGCPVLAALLLPPAGPPPTLLPPQARPLPLSPWCLRLQHLCCPWRLCLCPGSFHPGAFAPGEEVLGSSAAVRPSVCPSAEPTLPGKLRAAFGRAASGPGALLPGGPAVGLGVQGWPARGAAGWAGQVRLGLSPVALPL